MKLRSFARVAVASIAIGAVVAGCSSSTGGTTYVGSPPYTEGSGTVVTQVRGMATLHELVVSRGVTVRVQFGSRTSLSVTTDDNLQAQVLTTWGDERLTVTVDGNLSTRSGLVVAITTAEPIEVLSATAGASLEVTNMRADVTAVTVDSGSSAWISGEAAKVSLSVGAGSTGDLRDLLAKDVTVGVAAGSTGWVNVTGSVTGTCSAGSTLHVLGQPASQSIGVDAGSTVESG